MVHLETNKTTRTKNTVHDIQRTKIGNIQRDQMNQLK